MYDLSALIAPRSFIPIAGSEDKIFPIDRVRESFAAAKKIYSHLGVPENASLTETDKGHYWCEDIAWEKIKDECLRLGWTLS